MLRRKLQDAISGVNIDDIKDDEGTRSDVKEKLDAILSDYSW